MSAYGFRCALGVAWDERPVRAGRGACRTQHTNPLVNLRLEFLRLDKAVNAKSAEQVADTFADSAALRRQMIWEGRNERPPVRAAQHAAQNVYHGAQAITFVAAVLAVVTERQQRAAVNHLLRLSSFKPSAVNR